MSECAKAGGRKYAVPGLTEDEARRFASQISCSACNLQVFHLFYSPQERRLYARTGSSSPAALRGSARGRPALPVDALHVGLYSHHIRAREVLEDLGDLIARPSVARAVAEPRVERGTVAQPRPIPETTWEWARMPFHYAKG